MNFFNSTFKIRPDAKQMKRGGKLRPIRKTREGSDARLKQDLTRVLSIYVRLRDPTCMVRMKFETSEAASDFVDRMAGLNIPAAPTTPDEADQALAHETVRGYWPTLLDRGDGVRGHFCIGRLIKLDEPYWEFWNKGRWVSAGEVFIGRKAAQSQLDALRFSTALSGFAPSDRLSNQEDKTMNYDSYRAGMLRAAEMARDEFKRAPEAAKVHDCVYMSGYEDACDHLSVVIAQAAVINSVRIAGAQPDWQYHIALLLPEGVEDTTLLKVFQVVEHELRIAAAALAQARKAGAQETWKKAIDVAADQTADPYGPAACRFKNKLLAALESAAKQEGVEVE